MSLTSGKEESMGEGVEKRREGVMGISMLREKGKRTKIGCVDSSLKMHFVL